MPQKKLKRNVTKTPADKYVFEKEMRIGLIEIGFKINALAKAMDLSESYIRELIDGKRTNAIRQKQMRDFIKNEKKRQEKQHARHQAKLNAQNEIK